MTHLRPDEFVDAVDGMLNAERRRHVDAYAACRRQLRELERLIGESSRAPVPEPSPLFWDHFSARIQEAVRREAPPTHEPCSPYRWPALVPLGTLAALVLTMVSTLPIVAPDAPDTAATVLMELPDNGDDDVEWRALAELLGPLDWDVAAAAGLTVTPGDAERVVLERTEEERRELSMLIEGEITRAKS